ncbi:MAG: type VII secretion integral membrane protein EccD, partial [Mycobacteriaceae bacterium]|nr:type VII secretion integral membrane protein EccD [Mycobacteriaceae bacterium]
MVPTLDPDLVDVEPELSRVSVIGGNTQVDIALPATVPIAAYIADVVALIESRNPDLSEHDEGAVLHTRHWTLARLGQGSIPPHQSLTDAQVYDGELLVLRSVTSTEPPALFDDVIDAVSRLTTSAFGGWSAASARWTGLVAAVAAAAGASGLLMLSRAHQGGLAPALVGAGVGVIAL